MTVFLRLGVNDGKTKKQIPFGWWFLHYLSIFRAVPRDLTLSLTWPFFPPYPISALFHLVLEKM